MRETRERLDALAAALQREGLTADVCGPTDATGGERSVLVVNPAAEQLRDRIYIRHHVVDGNALWFFHSWAEPIGPARDIRTAVRDIHGWLQPRPGAALHA
jgi:hypothetical protein